MLFTYVRSLLNSTQGWVKGGSFLVGLLFISLMAAACSFGTTPSGSTNKTLIVDTSFVVDSLDPSIGGGATNLGLVYPAMYDTLLAPDQTNTSKLDPVIAQSYSASSDGLTVTFKLRNNIHFSDGTPLTSADVVFSLMRLKYLQGRSAAYMSGLTASASDPYTVVVKADQPNVFIASTLSFVGVAILNSKVLQANGGNDLPEAAKTDTAGSFLNQHSAGSGPYVLTSIDPKVQIVLGANPNYWGSSKPVYSKVIIRNEDASAQLLDVQQGQDTMALDLSAQNAATVDKSKVKILLTPSLETFTLMMNVNPVASPTTANLSFRQAVRYAIDYKALLGLAGPGAVQAQGTLPSGIPGSLPSDQVPTRDLAKARSLLAQSGISNPTLTFTYASDVTFFGLSVGDLAQLIQSNLKDLGVTVTLDPETNSVLRPRWFADKLQMYLQPLGANTFDASGEHIYFPGGVVAKFMGWTVGMYAPSDAAIAQITANSDPARTAALFNQEQRAANDFALFVPLFREPLVLAGSKSIGGLNLTSLGVVRLSELT